MKYLLTTCFILTSFALLAQNGSKTANFKALQQNTLQKLNTENVNADVPLSAEQQAIRQQRQAERAGQTFETRSNQQLDNTNIQVPAGSQNTNMNLDTSPNNPNFNFTPSNVSLTQAQKQERIKALLQQIKN